MQLLGAKNPYRVIGETLLYQGSGGRAAAVIWGAPGPLNCQQSPAAAAPG